MLNYHVEIDGLTIEIIRKPIKNMHLRIYPPDGQVRVTAPLRLSEKHIRSQIEAKLGWLHKQRARVRAFPAPTESTMQTGECHYFLGQACHLIVLEGSSRPMVTFNGQSLLLQTRANSTTARKLAHLNRWYHVQMQVLLPDLINKWQSVIGVKVASWGIKIMKSRWGYCNTCTQHICLNLNLIKKPISCLEYVLVHEMIHLLEASHNARFYQLMDYFMPQWREHKIKLNEPQQEVNLVSTAD